MRWNSLLITLILSLAWMSGCDSTPSPDPRAKPGHLIGRISDASGKPLKNVTITVSGFTTNNEPVTRSVTVEGPATEYSLSLPEGKYGTPRATINVTYHDQEFTLPLAPVDDQREWLEQKDSSRGIVRDFIWKITGRRPGTTENSKSPADFWGAAINFEKGPGPFGDTVQFEITLTPDGPLIDGTRGNPVVFERHYPWRQQEDHLLLDIPVGKYIATAKILYGKKPKPLKLICFTVDPENIDASTDDAATRVPVMFESKQNTSGVWVLQVPNLVAYLPK